MPPQGKPVQFRSADVEAQLERRQSEESSPGRIAARDLGRYYTMVDAMLPTLGLTKAEASVICDACNGIGLQESGWRTMWAEVYDACRLGVIGAKHGLDEQQQAALVEKMRGWTVAQKIACCDAVERFWLSQEATVQSVGLTEERNGASDARGGGAQVEMGEFEFLRPADLAVRVGVDVGDERDGLPSHGRIAGEREYLSAGDERGEEREAAGDVEHGGFILRSLLTNYSAYADAESGEAFKCGVCFVSYEEKEMAAECCK